MNKKLNRLRLDFSLPSAIERQEFINDYITQPQFSESPLTNDELEMIANYLLWGKDEDGKNVTQKKEIFIPTKNRDWDNSKNEDSLDELLESPTFNESIINRFNDNYYKMPRVVFSREKALAEAPAEIKTEFQNLFRRIDELDLLITFYELDHNKREKEPRPSLLKSFTDEEIEEIRAAAAHTNAYAYLKKRHQLIELRREQYTLQDSYQLKINSNAPQRTVNIVDFNHPALETEIPVFPLGLFTDQSIAANLFNDNNNLFQLSEDKVEKLTKYYWEKKDSPKGSIYFDFSNKDHLYEFFMNYNEFYNAMIEADAESTLPFFFKTLDFYLDRAELTKVEEDILWLKVKKRRNIDIVDYLTEKYNLSYGQNYISTIFKQKIMGKIANAATAHAEVIENLPLRENFKQCTKCGNIYLRNIQFFTRKKESPDGLSTRCKNCDREIRRARNEKNKG